MGITYEDAVKAQKALEDKILADPNVVSVGVIAEINELGEKTGDFIIKIGVISGEEYQSSVAHGDSLIPREYILRSDNDKDEKKCVRIQVVKTGQIRALSSSEKSNKNELPSAVDNIPSSSSDVITDHSSRRRPTPGGYSIGHPGVTAGTFGLLLEYEKGPYSGKAYILSNNHVMAANNSAYIGDAITDTIALLDRWVPLKTTEVNFVDAAIAEVIGGMNWSNDVMPYVSHIGHPVSIAEAVLGMAVEKTGRTTGYTTGAVISINQSVKVDYGHFGILTFKDQICTTSMSKGGDSGSCLFEKGTKQPVGLLFAGGDSESFHNPIKSVFSQLSIESFNKYPSGKTYRFDVDYSLRLIQKRPYSTMATPAISYRNIGSAHSLKSLPCRFRVALFITANIGQSITTSIFDKMKTSTSPLFFKPACSAKSVEHQPRMSIFSLRRK